MALDDRGYAALLLGQWARNHGIHEIRTVLKAALALADEAESGEILGIALEQAVFSQQVTPDAAEQAEPEAAAEEAGDATAEKPAARSRAGRKNS